MGMDHYNKVRDLGGQNGAFLAVDKQDTSKYVVIKRLGDLKQGMAELSTSLRAQNANIVPVLESFIHDGALYVVVEYQSGGDVAELVQRMRRGSRQQTAHASPLSAGAGDGLGAAATASTDSPSHAAHVSSSSSALPPPSVQQLLQWFIQLLRAVAYCHEQCIIHRDIKPSNIFVSQDTTTLYLGDFGSAKSMQSSVTTNTFVGSPLWLSPEVLLGMPYTYSSDIWALGCVFYEIATLRRPFAAASLAELVTKVTRGEFAPLPATLPRSVHTLISRMLTHDAAERLSAAEALQMTTETLDTVTRELQPARQETTRHKGGKSTTSTHALASRRRTAVAAVSSSSGGGGAVVMKHPCSVVAAAAAHGKHPHSANRSGSAVYGAARLAVDTTWPSTTMVSNTSASTPSTAQRTPPHRNSSSSSTSSHYNHMSHPHSCNGTSGGAIAVSSRRRVYKDPPGKRTMYNNHDNHNHNHDNNSSINSNNTAGSRGERINYGGYIRGGSSSVYRRRRGEAGGGGQPATAAAPHAGQKRGEPPHPPVEGNSGEGGKAPLALDTPAEHPVSHAPPPPNAEAQAAQPSVWLAARSKDVAAIETYLEQFRSYDTNVLTPEPPVVDEAAAAVASARSAPRRRRSVSSECVGGVPSRRFHRVIPAAPPLLGGLPDESSRPKAAAVPLSRMMSRATPQRRRSPTPVQQVMGAGGGGNSSHALMAAAAQAVHAVTRFATAPRSRVTACTASPFVRQRSAQSHLTRRMGSNSNHRHAAPASMERAPVWMAHGQRQASYANATRAPSHEERAVSEQEREAARARREEERSQMKMMMQEQRARARKDHKEQEPMVEIHLPNRLQYYSGES